MMPMPQPPRKPEPPKSEFAAIEVQMRGQNMSLLAVNQTLPFNTVGEVVGSMKDVKLNQDGSVTISRGTWICDWSISTIIVDGDNYNLVVDNVAVAQNVSSGSNLIKVKNKTGTVAVTTVVLGTNTVMTGAGTQAILRLVKIAP